MSLTNTQLRNVKAKEKAYKLFDEKGLFLFVPTKGSKSWRMKYRFANKEKSLTIGAYPTISLAEAREKRDEAKKLLANGVDPSFHKQVQKQAALVSSANTFHTIALQWFAKFSPSWEEKTQKTVLQRLEKHVFPWIGKLPITEINAALILTLLQRIEHQGSLETTRKVRQYCGQIFRYAVAAGIAERDPTQDLKGALQPPKVKHFATIIEPTAIGHLLCAIDGYQGQPVTKHALRLVPLLFVRQKELRHMEWSEINFETNEWRIPKHKMKMKKPHIVPLSTQAIAILEEIKPITGNGKYVFPGFVTASRPISDNTLRCALRRMGYSNDEITPHGFRSMASTMLNEQGWNHDAIERQLAHTEKDSVRASYNYAEYLPERRKMMQHWSDYLDQLKQKTVL